MSIVGQAKRNPLAKQEAFVGEHLERARSRIRTLDATAAVLGFLIGTLIYALTLSVCDLLFDLPPMGRLVLFLTYGVLSLGFLGVKLVWPLCHRINVYYAARQVEQVLPGAKNSVVNFLDLQEQRLPPAIRGAITQRAAHDVSQADLDRAISARRASWLGAVAGGLFLLLVILFLRFGAPQFLSLMKRAFTPFAEGTIVTRTTIRVLEPEEGNATVPIGRAFSVTVAVGGKVPERQKPDALKLLYHYQQNEPYEEQPLDPGENADQWLGSVPADQVHNGFWYKVTGGDAETPEYRVQVRSDPLLTDVEITYHFRPYLHWPDQASKDPNLEGMRATDVSLVVHTNRIIKEGRLELIEDKKYISAERDQDSQALRFHLVLDKSGTYRVWFTSVEGEPNKEPMPYWIKVKNDLAPRVALTKPGPEIHLSANGLLEVAGNANDDFGLTGLALQMKVNGEPLQAQAFRTREWYRLKDGNYPRHLEYQDVVDLSKVRMRTGEPLHSGMVLEYWLEATDNCDYPGPNIGRSEPPSKVIIDDADKDAPKQQQQRQQAQAQQQKFQKDQDKAKEQGQDQGGAKNSGKGEETKSGGDGQGDADKQLKSEEQKVKEALKGKGNSQGSEPKEGEPKSGEPKEGDQKAGDPKNGEPKEGEPKSGESKPDQPKSGEPKAGEQKPGESKGGEPKGSEPKNGEAKAGESKPGESNPAEPKSGEPKTDKPKAGEPKPGESKGGEPKGNEPKNGEAKAGESKPGESNPAEPKSGEPKTGKPKAGDPKGGDPKSGNPKTGEPKSGEPKAGDPKSGQPNAGDPKTGEPKNGDAKSGNTKAGEPKSGEPKTGDPKTGEPKSGLPNSGEPKAGDPKTGEPKNGDAKSGEPQSGEPKSSKPKSGESKAGEPNTGETKAGEPKPAEPKAGEPKAAEPKGGETKNVEPNVGEPKVGEPKSEETKTGEPKAGDPSGQGENAANSVKELAKQLHSSDPKVRENAQQKLSDLMDKASDPKVQKAAAEALKQGAKASAPSADPQVTDLAKKLDSKDPNVREEARKKLSDLQQQAKDPEVQKAAADALKKAGQEGEPKPGDKTQGESPDKEKSSGDKGEEARNQAGQPDKKQGAKGTEAKPGTSEAGNPQAGEPKNNDPSTSKTKPGTGDKANSNGPGKNSEPGDKKEVGTNPGMGATGNRDHKLKGGENKEAPPGSAADLASQRKAAELLLEEFRHKAKDKDFLKKLNWTDDQARQFQKDYEDYLATLRKKEAAAMQNEVLPLPDATGSSLPNTGPQRIQGGKGKIDQLPSGGQGLPPPPFREAYKELTEKKF